MIVNVKDLISYAIKKQFKISHVPCEVMVFEKDEIPASIKTKIEQQYDEKFLEDSDKVIFFKGPIDKDMVEKLFKATDKALGEDSNKLVIGDFKLLKVADTDDDFKIDNGEEAAGEDDGITQDEAPADEEAVPPSDEEVTDDEVNAVLDADEANEKAAEDAEDANAEEDADEEDDGKAAKNESKKKAVKKDKKLNEERHGLSIDDILNKGNKHAEDRNAKIAADTAKKNAVKQVWVQDFIIDNDNDNNSFAAVQITYDDGKVEDTTMSMSTTKSGNAFKRPEETHGYFVPGQYFKQGDELYREYKHNILRGQGKTPQCLPKGEQIKDADIRLAMLKFGFPSTVKWIYGKDKMSTPWYAFSYRTEPSEEAAEYLQKAERKSWMELEKAGRSRPIYSHGNTKIYRIHEDEEDENADGSEDAKGAEADEITPDTDVEAPADDAASEEKTEPEVPTRYVLLKVSLKG